MKKSLRWEIKFSFVLIGLSAFFYLLNYEIFHDAKHIFFYLITDIAFLFLSVLIVTLVIDRLLQYRTKQTREKKLNVIIGTFFSEAGTELLRFCARFDKELVSLSSNLVVTSSWGEKDFITARKAIAGHNAVIDSKRPEIGELKLFLTARRQFLLNLLENQNILEHESFTETLWAVFHLTDELTHRADFSALPEADWQHLSGDIRRAYQQLILQWLDYMRYLKQDYPYLFSLALRLNPFDAKACIEVKS